MRLLLLLAVLAVATATGRYAERNFRRMLDSSEEEFHDVEGIRKAEAEVSVRCFSIFQPNDDGYRTRLACFDESRGVIELADEGGCEKPVAVGKYRNDVNTTGWGMLELETFAPYTEEVQAYAAGVLEGHLTKLQISYHFRNTIEGMCNPTTAEYCKRLYRYLKTNVDWIQRQVTTQPRTDMYWRMVNLTYTQITGIYHGYVTNKTLEPAVEYELTPILMLHMSGELIDLEKALKKPKELKDDPEPSKCSGFLKLTEGNKDLLFSHVSMSGYNTMNRLLKLYKFAYKKDEVPGHTYSFSSYAGTVVSSDDYTLVSSGLASIETTFAIFNETLYSDQFIKPEGQLHCWVRSTIANQLARTAKEWTELFTRYNSGTYNNQWTVVDYKLFKPGQELPNNDVLWVAEQIPGYVESRDLTWFLKKFTYWPSYNIPYQNTVAHLSGFDTKGAENDWWRWGYAPRAKMFARDHKKVTDLNSLMALMRYNDYTHDEFSRCSCTPPYSAEASISTRGDLNNPNGTYEVPGMGYRNHGSLDYKGTDYNNFQKFRIHAVGGPTYDPLPPFSWANTTIVAPHYGQPTVWNFKPFITEWVTPVQMNLRRRADWYDPEPLRLFGSSEEDDDSSTEDF